MRLASTTFLAVASLVAISGCSAPAEETSGSSDDVTGVTDLSALEAELGLVKDAQSAAGTWTRPESMLKAGPCYKKTIGGPDGARYEVRRYTKGAAFFAKLGAGAESGDKRPIACVDVDVDKDPNGDGPITNALDGIALDTAMRYHLGRALGDEAGLGHVWLDFDRGNVEIGDEDHYCGIFAESAVNTPGGKAYAQAITTCKQHGGSEDTCGEQAMTACEKAVATDVVADTIDRPAFPSFGASPGAYFYSVQAPASDPKAEGFVRGEVAAMVYRYAWKVAANRNAFTLAGDPVGKFVKVDATTSDDDKTSKRHARFEKLDAHDLVVDGIEQIAITPKGSDDQVIERAIVLCTRTMGYDGFATSLFQCRGL
jgi:hypothetical protein